MGCQKCSEARGALGGAKGNAPAAAHRGSGAVGLIYRKRVEENAAVQADCQPLALLAGSGDPLGGMSVGMRIEGGGGEAISR